MSVETRPTVSTGDFAVVIPTWRRANSLAVCLKALARQTLPPRRVVVVHKADDHETATLVASVNLGWEKLAVSTVIVPADGNFLTQLNAGIAATTEPLVALTDDDSEAFADWLERLAGHFADPSVAGVGGRDWQAHDRADRLVVGKVSWYGRVIGNHHLGAGPPRDVDVLKGVNWSFRGDLLRETGIDRRLRGRGTVMNTEMDVCLRLRRRGWRLIFDPAAAVDHHTAPRTDGDVNSRGGFEAASYTDSVHNETLSLLSYLSVAGKFAFVVWAFTVGTSGTPGMAQVLRLSVQHLVRRAPETPTVAVLLARWRASLRGRAAGLRTYILTRRFA